MNTLLNSGTFSQVEAAIKKSNSRKDFRLALANEKANKNRVTVVKLLEDALKTE